MKTVLSCMKCFLENGVPNFDWKRADITDDGVYKLECNKGHISYQVTQNEKFEILFDMGADALNSGYKHEAVACFTTALERFHEWFINLILLKKGIDENSFNKTWNYVSRQSERQLGAFYFIYLLEFNEVPEMVNNKMTSFRNNVIHKGYIPTYEEVCDYGEYILNYIRRITNKLGVDYDNIKMKMTVNKQINLQKKYGLENESIPCAAWNTIINLTCKDEVNNNRTFKEALENVKEREELFSSL